MNWDAIGAVGELFGAIAVLVTLIYLTTQIKHNTLALKSSAAQAVHENFANWYSSAQGDPILLAVSIKGMRDYSSLSEIEKSQFVAMFMAFSSHTQNAYDKWQEESLTPELWRGWEYVSMNFFSTPGGNEFWKERSYMFADAFQSYIQNDLMNREPHPSSRPFGAENVFESSKTDT